MNARRRIVAAVTVCLLLAGAEFARRTTDGNAGLPEMARRLYRKWQAGRLAAVYAAQIPDGSVPVTVAVRIDTQADRQAISPLIYGMASAPADYLADLRLGLNRWGGNGKTRYNWAHGTATSAARDWRWANRPTGTPGLPPGPSAAADDFIRTTHASAATALITVPAIGWVARDADNRTTSLNVPRESGPPIAAADGPIAGYDPTENRRRTSLPSLARKGRPFADPPSPGEPAVYQDEWVYHLTRRLGRADRGGVKFYAIDNEPDLWDVTHTDIHPARMGYDDLLAKFLEYASAVKAVDPTAQVTGPVSWGWTGYFYSPQDRGADKYRTAADRRRHGGEPFLLWFLKQVRAHDQRARTRTLDVLDVHYYPQGQGLYQSSLDRDAPARRLRATRSLWDPSYPDESWIGEPVRLVPRLKEWIAAGYPGTKIGITEWNFGADGDINGALAVAEALGVYGREGVFLANYWAAPAKGSPGYLAFKLFRNADGRGSGFGDTACRATSANADQVSCFAATDTASGELALVLINKLPRATATVPVTIQGRLTGSSARIWRLAADQPRALLAGTGPAARDGVMTFSLPPSSVTLARIPVAR